jgi:hypothetical protein
VVLGRQLPGWAMVAIGGALLGWGVVRSPGAPKREDGIVTDHDTSHADAGKAERSTVARERVAALGAPADPIQLRHLAVECSRYEDAAHRQQTWQEQLGGLLKERGEKQERLAQALASRSVPHGDDGSCLNSSRMGPLSTRPLSTASRNCLGAASANSGSCGDRDAHNRQ